MTKLDQLRAMREEQHKRRATPKAPVIEKLREEVAGIPVKKQPKTKEKRHGRQKQD